MGNSDRSPTLRAGVTRRRMLAGGAVLTTVGLSGCTSFQSATGVGDSSSGGGETGTATGGSGDGEWTNQGLVVATSDTESLTNGLRIMLTVRSSERFSRVRAIGYAYDTYDQLLGQAQKTFDDVGTETIDITLDVTGFDSAYATTFDTDVTGDPAGFFEGLF